MLTENDTTHHVMISTNMALNNVHYLEETVQLTFVQPSVFLWQKTQLSAKHRRPVTQKIPLSKACLLVLRIKSFRAIMLNLVWCFKTHLDYENRILFFNSSPPPKKIQQKKTHSKQWPSRDVRKIYTFNKY